MGTLTISLSGTGVVNGSKSWTVSDADVINWINQLIATQTNPRGGNPPTAQQALVNWANGVVNTQIAVTKRYLDDLQKAQVNNPPPVFT